MQTYIKRAFLPMMNKKNSSFIITNEIFAYTLKTSEWVLFLYTMYHFFCIFEN